MHHSMRSTTSTRTTSTHWFSVIDGGKSWVSFTNGLVLKKRDAISRIYNEKNELVVELDETDGYTVMRKADGEQIYP